MITIHLKNTQPYALPRYQAADKRPDTGIIQETEKSTIQIYAPELTINLFHHRLIHENQPLSIEQSLDLFLAHLAQTKPFENNTLLHYPSIDHDTAACRHTQSEIFSKSKSFCKQPWVISQGLEGTPDLTVFFENDTLTLSGIINQHLSFKDFAHPSHSWPLSHIQTQPFNTLDFSHLTSACFAAGTALGWQENNPDTFHSTPFDFESLKTIFYTSYDITPLFHTQTRKTLDFSRRHKLKSRQSSRAKRRDAAQEMFFPVALTLMRAGWLLNRPWAPTAWVQNTPFWETTFKEDTAQHWFQIGRTFGKLDQYKDVDVVRFLKTIPTT